MRSLIVFGFMGLLATLVHFLVAAAIFRAAPGHIFAANVLGFMIAFGVSYFGHHRFTFRSTAAHRQAMPRFFATALVGLAINNAILALIVYATGKQSLVALAVAILCAAASTYVLSRLWAFAD